MVSVDISDTKIFGSGLIQFSSSYPLSTTNMSMQGSDVYTSRSGVGSVETEVYAVLTILLRRLSGILAIPTKLGGSRLKLTYGRPKHIFWRAYYPEFRVARGPRLVTTASWDKDPNHG